MITYLEPEQCGSIYEDGFQATNNSYWVVDKKNVYRFNGKKAVRVQWPKIFRNSIKPKNIEQVAAFDLCLHDYALVKAITGEIGTGKTAIAVWCGIHRVLNGEFDTITYLRSPVPQGREMGYLPGTLDEKFSPWVEPFKDQAEMVSQNFDDSRVVFIPTSYVKGRTFRQSYIIVDEAQDIRPEIIESLLGRVGEGSEIVFVGDEYQIDERDLSPGSNGLTHLLKLEGHSRFGHVNLIESLRSEVAQMAIELRGKRLGREIV